MPKDIEHVLDDDGARITLPNTGRVIRLRWRKDSDPQDVLDARTLHNKRLKLHNTLAAGLTAIASGKAPEEATERALMYSDEREKASRSVWDSCHLVISLVLEVPEGVDLRRAIPESSDGLWKLCTALYSRVGLSPTERDNLKRGVLEEWGVLSPESDGTVRTCACADLHRYGRCPNWPAFEWDLRAKEVWNQWRTAAAGASVAATVAYLDGAAIIDRIRAELDAEKSLREYEEAKEQWQEKP